MAAAEDATAPLADGGTGLLQGLPPQLNLPEEEAKTLEFWDEIDAFKRQLALSEGKPEYTFYDGPPFATGLPHYGHILAGTIKDTVTRFATQNGNFVSRRAGWDCHGLPVEFEIDKTLGINSRQQVLDMGIANYNHECRSIVSRYTKEWEHTVKRLGRWIDFENDYKTMNPDFMESVWWVFKSLFDKKLVYQGYKVMPYSTSCATPLSNFEAGLNYKDVNDPSVVVDFPLLDQPDTAFLAWTTTPWTLPSNLALCVSNKAQFPYVKIEDKASGRKFILMEERLEQLYPQMTGKKWNRKKNDTIFTVLDRFPGTDLVGTRYTPLFDFFAADYRERAFRVVADDYVTADSGTGIVHQAPAFGEDDYRVCIKNGIVDKGINVPCPVDCDGRYTDEVPDWQGLHVKEADPAICARLKADGRLVAKAAYEHSYPFCWRSDTPLIYKAVPSWFVAVESVKERLIKNNDQTYWVPDFVKVGRFHNWLQDAQDWAISRNRFWGTPLPLWVSEDGQEVVAIGSIAELETLAGLPAGSITDIHRESIDHIEIPSKEGRGPLRRVDEVFDCWFESGSMPYAQLHYPFENRERFERGFPAHFIAEGLDQTRGWFYTLMVLSTCLFDKPAFTNLIVNGMVLAANGKKMSKRLKNYPPPDEILDEYGADALRMYLINSPVVRAERLAFQKSGVKGVVRDVFFPWYAAFRFLAQNADRWMRTNPGRAFHPLPEGDPATYNNPIDAWVQSELKMLVKFVQEEMAAYRLYTVMKRLVAFLDDLTNWYIRVNRDRLKGSEGENEAQIGLSVLFWVLITTTSIMSPFTPFFAEMLYQRLRKLHPAYGGDDPEALGSAESVHFVQLPKLDEEFQVNEEVVQDMHALQTVVELGRKARDSRPATTSLKRPVAELVVVTANPMHARGLARLEPYVLSELNLFKLTVTDQEEGWVSYRAQPNFAALGKKSKGKMPAIKAAIQALTHADMAAFRANRSFTLQGDGLDGGFEVGENDLVVQRAFAGDEDKYAHVESEDGSMVVALDCVETPAIVSHWMARELVNRVQKLRKSASLEVADKIEVFFAEEGATDVTFALAQPDLLEGVVGKLRCTPVPLSALPSWRVPLLPHDTASVRNSQLTVAITKPGVAVSLSALARDFPTADARVVGMSVGLMDPAHAKAAHPATLNLVLDGTALCLRKGVHYFWSHHEMVVAEAPAA